MSGALPARSSCRGGAIVMKFHSMTSSCLLNRGTTLSQTVTYNNNIFLPQTWCPQQKHTHSAQRWLIKTECFTTALEAESPVSNFWLHAICACTEQHSEYRIRWENGWLGLRIWCLGKCVGLGFMLQLEKENNWILRLSPIFFIGFTYSRAVVGIWHLTKKF